MADAVTGLVSEEDVLPLPPVPAYVLPRPLKPGQSETWRQDGSDHWTPAVQSPGIQPTANSSLRDRSIVCSDSVRGCLGGISKSVTHVISDDDAVLPL